MGGDASAQRLSASLFVPRRSGRYGWAALLACSTPFGIIVRSTKRHSSASFSNSRCSTPFGIIVRSTSTGHLRDADAAGAQRLSASLFVPPPMPWRAPRLALCSTPFGIIVRSTLVGEGLVGDRGQVLNAFRHHCSFHPAAWSKSMARKLCAQRLSASLFVPQLNVTQSFLLAAGAQRLSASLFVPRGHTLDLERPLEVLNAFRHHCSFHSSNTDACTRHARVLNAFRHHCSFHSGAGANGGRTAIPVLNAFRHHCSFHHDGNEK